MVPLATLANRLHRTVRVSARKRGKVAELVLDGVSTELDKTVMEQLAGPLEHLLRNAVDHGIEDSESRRAAGKPECGVIRLSAAYEGTQVVVHLTDDGSGLDLDKIRKTAIQLGYHTEAEAAILTPADLSDLIFEPGFSTAESITEISGRGIGLDVVKAGVEALKGTVSLHSREGQGVKFTIRLPMTLVITKVLMLEAQQERYAIPLAAVTRTTRIDSSQIELSGQRQMIKLEDRVLPVVHLAEWLEMRAPGEPPPGRLPLVVVRAGEGEVALIADRVMEAREVMVKPLEGLLRRVPRMTGATILGDGSVVLIVNPVDLSATQQQRAQAPVRRRVPARRGSFEILIVDDSPSVRRAVANLVRNAGWIPSQAKDGVEALEILQRGDRRPDAILMDIEMPRMDGFELTSSLRSQTALRSVPVIMLTSRSGEKHRKKAIEVGVNEYLVKPFQDDALVEVIRRCVEESRKVSQVA
jgi:chemosensory pili system protein ChpA (sensor histidine kinase/response regulator)